MSYYHRNDASEETDVDKTSSSKECDICHCCTFLDKQFNLQPHVCNGSNDLLMMYMNLNNIAIFNNKDSDYCCIISGISNGEAINSMQNIDMIEKSRTLHNIKFLIT